MQAILKSKLDKDIQPYIILGACNFAYNAIWTVPIYIGTDAAL